MVGDRELLGYWRWPMFVAAVISGFLSNSKTFILGVPALAVMVVPAMTGWRKWTVFLGAMALFVGGLIDPPEDMPINPAAKVDEAEDPLDALTTGRFRKDGSILEVSSAVLDSAPILGYGFGRNPELFYADSAINRYVIYSGLLGVFIAAWGFIRQTQVLYRSRHETAWAGIGWRAVVIMALSFAAGTFMQAPRINDLFSVLLGLSISNSLAARRAVAQPSAPRNSVLSPATAPGSGLSA
jgi:hypothetical protein